MAASGEPPAAIWGPWKASFHASGSCMVILASGGAGKPHLYVFADPLPDDPQRGQRNRRVMCSLLADWLNGVGPRPVWLDDFHPEGRNALTALTGAAIVATGPWVRRDAKPGEWRQDNRPEAKRNRRLLLQAVMRPE